MASTTSDTSDGISAKRQRNWWKVAFFVALFAFELAREFAVLASAEVAEPNATLQVFGGEGFATARGRWTRSDGGDPLVRATVNIECYRDRGECIEASTMMRGIYVYAPEIDRFAASFTDGAVTYENDIPDCAKYSVRIDLRMERVFAVRERKENPTNPNCAQLERRIDMQLSDSYQSSDPLEGHFVPLFYVISKVVSIF